MIDQDIVYCLATWKAIPAQASQVYNHACIDRWYDACERFMQAYNKPLTGGEQWDNRRSVQT